MSWDGTKEEAEAIKRHHAAESEAFMARQTPEAQAAIKGMEDLATMYADERDAATERAESAEAKLATAQAEVQRLTALLNTPEIHDFAKAVNLEAAHQRERWGAEQDAGKSDADWFWLIGYLAGKALHKPEKRLHHLVTTAAALANWHLYTLGKTDMRPGIEPPKENSNG